MRSTNISKTKIWVLTLFLVIGVVLAVPQSALAMTVPLQNASGKLELNGNGNLFFSDFSNHTGSVKLSFDFTIPDISSTQFNNAVTAPGPIDMTGHVYAEQGAGFDSLTLHNVFSGPQDFLSFMPIKPNTAGSWVAFDNGQVSLFLTDGQYELSDIWLQLSNVGYGDQGNSPGAGDGQITSGTLSLIANGFDEDYYYVNDFGTGHGDLEVTSVPAPNTLALFGLGFVLLLVAGRKYSNQG